MLDIRSICSRSGRQECWTGSTAVSCSNFGGQHLSHDQDNAWGQEGTACSYMADSLYIPFLIHFIHQPCHELPQLRLRKLKTS